MEKLATILPFDPQNPPQQIRDFQFNCKGTTGENDKKERWLELQYSLDVNYFPYLAKYVPMEFDGWERNAAEGSVVSRFPDGGVMYRTEHYRRAEYVTR